MKFTEDGLFEVKAEAQLLLIDATGPLNAEMAKLYIEAVESCIQQLEGSPWNQVVTLHQLSLLSPEVEKFFTVALINRRSRGLLAIFVIIEDVYFTSLVKEQMSRCYTKAGIEHHFLDSAPEEKKGLIHLPSRLPLTNFC